MTSINNKKQEIISILEDLDEDALNRIYSLVQQMPRKGEKIKYSTSSEVKEIWDKVSELIKVELTDVSYNTWIKNIIPIEIKENIFKIAIENEFTKGIIEGRYGKLIINALYYVTDRRFDLEVLVR